MKRIFTFSYLLILLMQIIAFPGCGGGTTGTGGTGSTEFSGKILDDSGAPVGNAMVTIEETGDSAVTDDQGNFTVETSIESSSVTVRVQSEATDVKTTVDDIPDEPQSIAVTFEINRRKNTLSVKRRDVIQRPTRTPRPTPESKPTTPGSSESTPAPTAVASPTLKPKNYFTTFRGTVVSSERRLITRARVGIAGKNLQIVGRDGRFTFIVAASTDNSSLEVRDGDKGATLLLSGINQDTKSVTIQIRIEAPTSDQITVSIESISTVP